VTKDDKLSPEEFNRDQILVATPHARVLASYLAEKHVRVLKEDESADLGLTLLEVPVEQVEAAARLHTAADAPDEPLSRLFHMIYDHFSNDYVGWVPTIGKNRLVRPVMGAGHNIGGGGKCWPKLAHLDLAPRPAEPGARVRVGVADTAIYAHPWLAGAYQAASTGIWADGEPTGYVGGHATFIAGLIAQRAPGAMLDMRAVLSPELTADAWQVAQEVVRLGRSGIDVLNLSFSTFTDDNVRPMVLKTALDRIGPDVVVVAAAGNHGASSDVGRPSWPAADPDVVAVTAVDSGGQVPEWSTAPDRPWVDVVATGEEVVSTFPRGKFEVGPADRRYGEQFDGFASWGGTSFATAQVTGAIAALTVPGRVTAAEAFEQVLSTAFPLPVQGSTAGKGDAQLTKPWIR
jgi:hypothetical protein